jgi:hypothetical protein
MYKIIKKNNGVSGAATKQIMTSPNNISKSL